MQVEFETPFDGCLRKHVVLRGTYFHNMDKASSEASPELALTGSYAAPGPGPATKIADAMSP